MISISFRQNNKSLIADINIGKIKKTPGQRKKHISQMTSNEISFLVYKIQHLDKIIYSNHLLKKHITFNEKTILKTLKSSNLKNCIIEYNETPSKDFLDRRVLIRSEIAENVLINNNNYELCNLCFVLSIVSKKVITVYYNKSNDNHTSLNLNRYDNTLKIIY